MSTVLAKAAHSLYFLTATPKIPTAFYFDKQNQHVFAEFEQENCPRKNKTVKNISSLNQSAQQFCQQFHQTAQQFPPNCSAVSPQTAQQFGLTAQQFPPNCSSFPQTAQQFGQTKLLSSFSVSQDAT